LKILSNIQKDILDRLQRKPYTLTQLAKVFGKSEKSIQRHISVIRKAGKVVAYERLNSKKGKYYVPSSIDDIMEQQAIILPSSSCKDLVDVPVKDNEDFSIGLVNTIYAGGMTNEEFFKNFLKYNTAKGTDAIAITGNLFWMDLTGFSKYTPDRAANESVHFKDGEIGYPPTVENSLGDPVKLMEENEAVFVTCKERFEAVIKNSLKPLFVDSSGQPLYDKPIYVIFGHTEEDFVRQQVNHMVRVQFFREKARVKQNLLDLREELKSINSAKRELEKQCLNITHTISTSKGKVSKEAEEGKEVNLEEIAKDLESKIAEMNERISKIEEQKKDWEEYKGRLLMRNYFRGAISHITKVMKAYLINQIESAIPNCTVISTGTGALQLGDKKIELVYNARKRTNQVSDTLMNNLVEQTAIRLKQKDKEEIPDVVVGGGLSTNYTRVPKPCPVGDEMKIISIIQLATCLNKEDLEKRLHNKVLAGQDPMARIPTQYDFNPEALVLQYVSGIERREKLTPEFLTNNEIFNGNIEEIKKRLDNEKMMYEADFSDQHVGSKNVSISKTPEGYEYSFVLAQEFLFDIGAPIVRFNSLGDETQEQNYDTANEPMEAWKRPSELAGYLEELLKKDLSKEDIIKMQRDVAFLNTIRSGIISPQEQRFEFCESLNYALLNRVLENARKIGLVGYAIKFINGNHNEHTFEGKQIVTKDIAREVRRTMDASKSEVGAPTFGGMGLHTGVFGINGKYMWGEYARHKQGKSSKKDTMRQVRLEFNLRGQDFPELLERYIINYAGHDHIGGETSAQRVHHIKLYCYMDRNAFGEKLNYGPPTLGFAMLGLPVNGPGAGPIVTIDIFKHYVESWAQNGRPKIRVDKLFEKSIIEPV